MILIQERSRPRVALVLITTLTVLTATYARATPLDDYVAAPDPTYAWHLDSTITGSNYTGYVLYLASQTWRSPTEVDRTLWEHWLVVIVPDNVNDSYSTAMLYIGSGSNGGGAPTSADSELVTIAHNTESIVADLSQVPNQPLTFAGEGFGRYEDALIAYCWDKHLNGGDDWWPTRLPMTKAAVRAMDTVQAFCSATLSKTISDFVVSGASKRGWTTWATAAVDSRVEAIIPMVIDVLNVEESMRHHYAVYGFWAPAIHDYEDMGIMNWMGTPEFAALMAISDPYFYRTRYTMPKFVINSTGDQFFLPDSSQFYFDELPAEKHLRYVPNTDHGLSTAALDDLEAYYAAILNGVARPEFSWTKEPDGSIRVTTVTPPTQVLLWQATNPSVRDFRLDVLGAAWSSSPLAPEPGGDYVAQVAPPPTGYTAFLVELAFDSGGDKPFRCTTEVSVIAESVHPISIDGDMSDWTNVPGFHDLVDDTHDTDHDQQFDVPTYVEHPDVDVLEYKFTHDAENLYAYFKATGEIGRTQTAAMGNAGRYYVIVTIDVDNDDATGYWLHEGGYYPTTNGYDMNMEVEYYDGAFNTGHYLNHGCVDEVSFLAAQVDQANGIVNVLPGSYDWYTQWVWWDTPQGIPGEITLPLIHPDYPSTIIWVEDRGPVYQGILEIALSPDSHEAEMVAPFRGFMRHPDSTPIIELGNVLDISFSLEASGELAPGADWASDTAEPINAYYLTPGTLAVTSPNGGEVWDPGTSHDVTWQSQGAVGQVDIVLESGGPPEVLAMSEANDGAWTWNIPFDQTPGDDYRIVVRHNTGSGTLEDESDADFSINAPSITVTAPNDGEAWPAGSVQTIAWNAVGVAGNAKIWLFKGGAKVRVLRYTVPAASGSWNWYIPGNETLGSDYQIKVVSKSDSSLFDFSDAPFSITAAPITVTAPNGGEAWPAGTYQTITWDGAGVPGDVKIWLFKGWVRLRVLSWKVPAGTGSYTWYIPGNETQDTDYRVKIVSKADPGIYDFSDSEFAVTAPLLTVTSPNGGETWSRGAPHPITWTAPSLTGDAKILLFKGGVKVRVLQYSTPMTTGTWTWDIPPGEPLGSDYTIKIVSLANPDVVDFSDGAFTIE